jgi:Asp-tRNA(Asn)/Glu-tRNA(Gln) amidotransferase A subunit family amidase
MSDPRTTIGPLARSAGDLAALLEIIAGSDDRDPGSFPIGIGTPEGVDLSGLRIATFTDLPGAQPTAETVAAVQSAAATLEGAGCTVETGTPDRLGESMPITRAYWARVQSVSFRDWMPPRASTLTADRMEQSRFEWERFTREMFSFMQRYDAILCPTAPQPAPPHGEWTLDEYLYTLPFSLTRQPAISVPWTTTEDSLPIGVQLAGRAWRDDVVIALAIALEERRGPLAAPQLAT